MKSRRRIFLGLTAALVVASTGVGRAGEGMEAGRVAELRSKATAILREALDMKIDALEIEADDHIARGIAYGEAMARLAAARELIKDKDCKEAVELLKKMLVERNICINCEQTDQAAIIAELYGRDHAAAKEVIEKIFAGNLISAEYRGAVEALWRVDAGAASDAAITAIEKHHTFLVVAFYEAAAEKPERLPDKVLDAMLKNDNETIRLMGACEKARRGDASVIKELAENLAGDRTSNIEIFGDQHLAARGLGDLYAKGGRAALIKQIPDKREFSGLGPTSFGDLAAWEIMDRATKEDVKLLEEFCKNDEQRPYALPALMRVSPEAARPWLQRGMEDQDEYVHLKSAGQLAKLGDEKAIAFLEESCYRKNTVGDFAGQNLLVAGNDKSRAAFMRVLKTAAEEGNDVRHDMAQAHVRAAFNLTEEIVPVLKEVLAFAKPEQLNSMWDALSGRSSVLSTVEPILNEALARKKYAAVVGAVQYAKIENEAEKKLAAKYLTACQESDEAMRAVQVGRERKLLADDVVLTAVRRHVAEPQHTQECVDLLGQIGTSEDLKVLAEGIEGPAATAKAKGYDEVRRLFDRVYWAIAVRRIVSRIPE